MEACCSHPGKDMVMLALGCQCKQRKGYDFKTHLGFVKDFFSTLRAISFR